MTRCSLHSAETLVVAYLYVEYFKSADKMAARSV